MKELTKLQSEGLKYAAGEQGIQPSAYIGNKLAALGLIIYTGDRYQGSRLIVKSTNNRAWDITEKGKTLLHRMRRNVFGVIFA